MAPLRQEADTSFTFQVYGHGLRSGFQYQSIFSCQESQCRIGSPSRGAELAVDCLFGELTRKGQHVLPRKILPRTKSNPSVLAMIPFSACCTAAYL